MRITIRFNEIEELRLKELQKYLHEEDMSKVVKFGVETALHHINFVTSTAVSPNWNVLFTRKRKTQKQNRVIY
ncbi:MAG: hypothetical protein KAQ83_00520 [Nanoarchaeota archaeon]|nr:hypothetical protein [Nanoarchaeota archaeon]